MNFTVKVSFNGDIRRFNFTAPSSSSSSSHPFNSLLASVVKLYSPKLNNLTGAPVLKYLDDEQELVTLSTDDELREAYDLAAASSSGQKVLKLFVFAPAADQNGNGDNESDEEEASPLAPADAAPASSRVWSVQVEDASPEQEQEFDAAPAVTITSVPSSPAVASSFFATQASAPPPSSSAPAPAAETKQDVKEDTKEDVKEDPQLQPEEDSCGGAGGAFGAAGGSCFGRIMLFVHDFLAQPGAFDALRAVWPSVKAELLQGVPVNDIIERAINGEKSPFSAELKNHPALQIALSKSDRLAHLYSFATARFPFAVPLVIRFVDNFLDGAVDLESLQHSLPFAFLRGAFGGRDAETGAFGGFPRGPCGPCSPAAPAAAAAASASATSACGGRSHCASRSESRCRPHPQCHRATAAAAAAASAPSSACHPHAGAAPRFCPFSPASASSSSSSSASSASVAHGGRSTVSAPAPTSASAAVSESEVVHAHVQCDGCQIYPIVGARYKCTRCHNYDLCESCESTGQHPADHPLLKFRVPFDGEVSIQGGGHHGHHGPHRHHGRHGCHGRPHGAPCGPFGPFGPFRGRCLRRFFAAEDNEAEGGDDYTAQAELAPAQLKPDAPAAAPSSSSFPTGDVDSKNNTVWKAVLEQHKSLPDNSWCRPDTELMKVWSVRNNGSAPWPAGTRVVFVRGDVAPLASATPVPAAVPGEVVNVSVRVRTPAKEGSFVGQYQVQTGEGLNLLDEPLHVAVKVVDPSAFGAASTVATAATETPRVAVASQVRAPSSATIVPAPEPSTPAAASVATVSTPAAPAAAAPAPAAPAAPAAAPAAAPTVAPTAAPAAPAATAAPVLPRDQPQSEEAFPYADQLRELTGMGFTNERLVKYLLINKGGNVLAVLEWLLQHA